MTGRLKSIFRKVKKTKTKQNNKTTKKETTQMKQTLKPALSFSSQGFVTQVYEQSRCMSRAYRELEGTELKFTMGRI